MNSTNIPQNNIIPEPPAELIDAINQGRCILFVGAGFSRRAGLPGWEELISNLKQRAIDYKVLSNDTAQALDKLIKDKNLLLAAQVLKEHLGQDEFCKFMLETFDRPDITPTDIHNLLTTIPFRAAITSNFDTLLDQAYRNRKSLPFSIFTHKDVEQIARAQSSDDFYLFHLHGLVQECETIVLSELDYRQLIHEQVAYNKFIEHVLISNTVLFLGFSLNDTDLKTLVDKLAITFNGHTPRHYAFIPKREISELQVKFYHDHSNINILTYEQNDDTHQEVDKFLTTLADKANKQDEVIQYPQALTVLAIPSTNPESDEETSNPSEPPTSQSEAVRRKINEVYPELNPGTVLYIEEHVKGDLNLAIGLALGLKNNPATQGIAELLRTPEMKEIMSSIIPSQYVIRRTLQVLSLLSRVGLEGDVEKEGRVLANFFGLDFDIFRITIDKLCDVGIVLKQGRYRSIENHFLAVHFASQVWHSKRSEITSHLLFDEDWLSLGAIDRFLESLANLGEAEIARPLVKRLLVLFFTDINSLDNEHNSQIFSILADANPEAAAIHLESILRFASHERLLNFRAGRRKIIWTLEKLLLLRKTFWIAARLILRLAAAENETWGNNATGVWKDIFLIRLNQTAFSPIERYQLIEEALNAQSVDIRLLGIIAISEALSVYETRSISWGPGGYIVDLHWHLTSNKEFWEARFAALELLDFALADSDEKVVSDARKCLMQSASGQMPNLADEVLDRLEMIPIENNKKEMWDLLQAILKFEGKNLADKQRERILDWSNSLIQKDNYHDELLRWVVSVSFTEFDQEPYDRHQKIDNKVRALAEKSCKDPNLFHDELPWLAGQNAQFPNKLYLFGQFLGQCDTDRAFFNAILSQVQKTGILDLLIAYLHGKLRVGDEKWVSTWLDEWANDAKQMIPVVLELTRHITQDSEAGALRLRKLLDKAWIKPTEFSWWSDWIKQLSIEHLQFLMDAMNNTQIPDHVYASLSLLYNWLEDKSHQTYKPQLTPVVLQILSATPGDWGQEWRFWHYWEGLALFYLESHRSQIVKIVLDAYTKSNRFFTEEGKQREKILQKALIEEPQLTFYEIGERMLLDPSDPRHIWDEKLAKINFEDIVPTEILLDWAAKNQPNGPKILAKLAHTDKSPLPQLARQLIIHYSYDEDVLISTNIPFGRITTWVGSFSDHLKRELDLAKEWLKDEHPLIRNWAANIVSELEKRWENAKQKDDEDLM